MHVNPTARIWFWTLFLAVLVLGISVCLVKEDAVAILEAERDGGIDKANEKFQSLEKCANLPVVFTPKKVVAMVKTARGVGRVVEIQSGGETAYWLTYLIPSGFKEV